MDTSKVVDFYNAFTGASKFNEPLATWATSGGPTIEGFFGSAASFKQLLNTWDTSSAKDMGWMFDGAADFNQPL